MTVVLTLLFRIYISYAMQFLNYCLINEYLIECFLFILLYNIIALILLYGTWVQVCDQLSRGKIGTPIYRCSVDL